MTDVNINIDAMRAMLNGLTTAQKNVADIKTGLEDLLNKAAADVRVAPEPYVSTYRLNDVTAWIDASIPDVNRRLALAEEVAAATPSFHPGTPVTIDDDRITTLSVWQASTRGRQIAQRLADGRMTDQDWDDLADLDTDPYFAAALANNCPPQTLAQAALGLSSRYQIYLQNHSDAYRDYTTHGGDLSESDWTAEQADAYQRRLESLGTVLGAATRSGRLGEGYAAQVVEVFHQTGPLPAAMGAVLGCGTYETGFAITVAIGVYDYERGDDFPKTWSQGVAAGTSFTQPDGTQLTDPMPGVMTMLSTSPDAAQLFFRGGPSSTSAPLTVIENGRPTDHNIPINDRLTYLLTDRVWAVARGSDEGDGLGRAIEAAASLPGDTGRSIAQQAFAAIWRREADQDGWNPYPGLIPHLNDLHYGQGSGAYPQGLPIQPAPSPEDKLSQETAWKDIEDYMVSEMNNNAEYQTKSGKPVQFFDDVYPGHKWDHKSFLREMIDGQVRSSDYYLSDPDDPRVSLYYDIWSNIHYGYVGASAGYSETILMKGQRYFGDSDAIDDLSVSIGFELAEKYPPGTLTPQILQQAIDDHMFDFLSAAAVPPASQVRVNV